MTNTPRLITTINGIPIKDVDPESIRFKAGDRIAIELESDPSLTMMICRCGYEFTEKDMTVRSDNHGQDWVEWIGQCPSCGYWWAGQFSLRETERRVRAH